MRFDSFVLAASTADLDEEPAAREHADAVEFRMDLAVEPFSALDDYDGELPLLVTNRAVWEGGEAGEDGPRLDALAEAVAYDAVAAVDVELVSMRDGSGARVAERAREHDVAVVVSTHDFRSTPSRTVLDELLREAGRHGDVAKLAVTATDRSDVLDLLAVTLERTGRGDRVATMAMGEAGRHSRAVAPVYGSKIGYAPVDPSRATAPGQYDLATLATLVGALC